MIEKSPDLVRAVVYRKKDRSVVFCDRVDKDISFEAALSIAKALDPTASKSNCAMVKFDLDDPKFSPDGLPVIGEVDYGKRVGKFKITKEKDKLEKPSDKGALLSIKPQVTEATVGSTVTVDVSVCDADGELMTEDTVVEIEVSHGLLSVDEMVVSGGEGSFSLTCNQTVRVKVSATVDGSEMVPRITYIRFRPSTE